MKVVLTVWENRISPVADSARHLLVVDVGNRKGETAKTTVATELAAFLNQFERR